MMLQAEASSFSTVSRSSRSVAARRFSSRCATLDVPGIGSITDDRCSSHASATAGAVTPNRWAASATGPPGSASRPDAIGNQGRKPMPCSVQ